MKRKETLGKMRVKPPEELKKELAENQERLWSLKGDLVQGKVKNVAEIKQIKKNIARIKTLFLKSI